MGPQDSDGVASLAQDSDKAAVGGLPGPGGPLGAGPRNRRPRRRGARRDARPTRSRVVSACMTLRVAEAPALPGPMAVLWLACGLLSSRLETRRLGSVSFIHPASPTGATKQVQLTP